ncbi:DUF4124 domain-containing protein [Stutzerimonas balearica]|uniref:DUF4124 domain-containing protein n=1 Tax=Stutzerimonas balearica TaxID=74829 RepID=UPI0035E46709
MDARSKTWAAGSALALLLLAQPASSAIYKCTGPDGKLQFADKPCGGLDSAAEQLIEVAPAQSAGNLGVSKEQQEVWSRQRQRADRPRPAAPAAGRNFCRSYSSTELRSIVISNGVQQGMTKGSVQQAWGAPTVVNGGRLEQWVYRWPRSTSYVYFVGGCVYLVEGGYGR